MADPAGTTTHSPHSRPSAPRVRLMCEACRQRKVKCDKLSPCTSCQKLGFLCVPVERARLPRGRTRKAAERPVGSDKELSDRVARLEKLLKQVVNKRQVESQSSLVVPESSWPSVEEGAATEARKAGFDTRQDGNEVMRSGPPSAGHSHIPGPSTAYMGNSFWEDIMQQTHELRNVLEDRLANDDIDTRDPEPGFGTSLVSSESPESQSTSSPSNRACNLSPNIRHRLCDIFLHNVDPLFKVLHRPSLQAFLKDETPYLDYEQDHNAPATLASAVYLCAVCTLDEAECQLMFNTDKMTAVAEFQKETEAALVRADFVTTNDLTVLQAYIISLVSCPLRSKVELKANFSKLAARSQDQSRRVWTMLSMALRVGQALSLHIPEPPFTVRPFEKEMRRRTWLGIGVLDIAVSLDRASDPMMQAAWLDSNQPSNINDEEIWFDMDGPIPEHTDGTFTDMTHTLVIAASASVARSLAFSDLIEPPLNYHHSAAASRLRLPTKGFTPAERLQTRSVRFPVRSRNFTPPRVGDNALLKIAADNLQWSQDVYTYPGAAAWRWYGSMWVPWHALAVALAELCVCKDPAVMVRYWSVVADVFERSRLVIADSQHGMLWKPMERLMAQAKARRNELLDLDASRHQVSQGSFDVFSNLPEHPQPLMDFSLNLGDNAAQPPNMHVAPVPSSFTPVPWANVWDAMDLNEATLQSGSDDTAWLNYENFLENVYDSVDSIFLPR
ncbi:Transcription factor [Penicillium bovifimosum]|uniref:Transcription factor n=1 Tax=Penicillium bovifimosum TaxID=126998 RepID=A0A9W9GTD5_9EURO|nr:Transcription factor [Penicillium bovifimosum]KAJ5129586.1 Transcription factor [Penicillium bovifimosum]